MTDKVRLHLAGLGCVVDPEWRYERCDAKIPFSRDGDRYGMTWDNLKAGKKPTFVSLVDKTEKVKKHLASLGCIVEPEWRYEASNAKIPFLKDGNRYAMTWNNLRGGRKPSFISLVDKTSYVKSKIEAEGVTIDPDWMFESTKTPIPMWLNDELYQMTWERWDAGYRLSFRSLVDKTGYVKSKIETEGVTIDPDWQWEGNNEPIPMWFRGWLHQMTWGVWDAGNRLSLKTLVDKTGYVKSKIETEGVTIDPDWQWEGSHDPIPMTIDGIKYKFTWNSWNAGCRPDFKSIIDKTSYVREFLAQIGFSADEAWRYEENTANIPVIKDGIRYQITWSILQSGGLPSFVSIIDKESYIKEHCQKFSLEIIEPFSYGGNTIPFKVRNCDGKIFSVTWNKIANGYYPGSIKRLMSSSIRSALLKSGSRIKSVSAFVTQVAAIAKSKIGDRPSSNHHLDHIIPHSFFSYESEEEIRLCWHPDNLRWLPAKTNLSRSNRLSDEEVALMTPLQLKILKGASFRFFHDWPDERINRLVSKRKKRKSPGQLSFNLLAAS